MTENTTEIAMTELEERRIRCLVAFLHPFRIVDGPTSPEWNVTIDQVNTMSWDYAALHEMVGGIDVGLDAPYHLVVCRDGGLVLPPIPSLRDEHKAVEFFNRCLAALLVGGIYCEAIALDGLDFGSILDWKYVRTHGRATSASSTFHFHVRQQRASVLESIALRDPRKLTFKELADASKTGRSVLEQLPEVSGDFLLRGCTGYAHRDWGVALANLWIVAEQMTSQLWEQHILSQAKNGSPIAGRVESLNDNRTWTIGVKHEVLFQRGVLSSSAFAALNKARKARNKLSHSGVHPDEQSARAVLDSVRELFKVLVPNNAIPFLDLDLDKYGLSDPFRRPSKVLIEPEAWMKIKKLPGESELEKLEAEERLSKIRKSDSLI